MLTRFSVALMVLVTAALGPNLSAQSSNQSSASDSQILHALNRLTFGPRPGDLESVRTTGLQQWIQSQLHPENIAENPILEEKLKPLNSLRMNPVESLENLSSVRTVTINGETLLFRATAMASLQKLQVETGAAALFEGMYRDTGNDEFRKIGADAFALLKRIEEVNALPSTPANGARYPGGELGQALFQVARLIKADLGVEAVFVDYGGWDHHTNETQVVAQMLGNLSNSLSAFSTDLGSRMEDVVLVTMSEFGRTAFENGNGGTDHGHGNLMMVLGGPVQGGKIYGDWPGLSNENLFQERDLAVTSDFRDVLGEILTRHVGIRDLAAVFPDYKQAKALGFLRA
jgi:hypothetical protein